MVAIEVLYPIIRKLSSWGGCGRVIYMNTNDPSPISSRVNAEVDSRNIALHKKVLEAGTLDIIPETERKGFLVWFQGFFNKKVEIGREGSVQGERRV